MTSNVGVAGVTGATTLKASLRPVHLSPAAATSPAMPSLNALFDCRQAAALRDAGFDVIGWVVLS